MSFTRRKSVRKTALLNTTALITFDRASESYFPHFRRFFDETLTLDFILREEIVFERRIRDSVSNGYLVLYGVKDDDVAGAERLLRRWRKLALADALIITVGLRLVEKGEVFVITDDLIERRAAEENGLTTLWTSTLAVVFHYLGFTSLPKYIEDVKDRGVLWVSGEVLKVLRLFESEEAMEILLSLHESSKSYESLVSRYSNKLVDALMKANLIVIKEGKYALNERHDIIKLIPNVRTLKGF